MGWAMRDLRDYDGLMEGRGWEELGMWKFSLNAEEISVERMADVLLESYDIF